MGVVIDITGQRFGKLKAIRGIGNGPNGKWVFVCDCGTEKEILKQNVTQGKVKSCGCLNKERGRKVRLNLIGQKFGRLTVSGVAKFTNKSMFDCLCDCGKYIVVAGSYLLSGHTKSCGCLRTYRLKKGEAGLSILYKFRYKARAKRKGLDFNISLDDFKVMTKMRCHYCGVEPSTVIRSKSEHSEYVYNGLDRVDSSLGYTLDNVVPCCVACNRMKLDYSRDEFMSHIRNICDYTRLAKMEEDAGLSEEEA